MPHNSVEKRRIYRNRHREKLRRTDPEKYRRQRASGNVTRYGISVAEFEEMYRQSDGLCAICRRPETLKQRGRVQRLSIDHCHDTLKVRGLVCKRCNTAIGLLYDDPLRARALAEYLERNQ